MSGPAAPAAAREAGVRCDSAAVAAAAGRGVARFAVERRRRGLGQRALAAVGQGPVLHVVTEQPSPYGSYSLSS